MSGSFRDVMLQGVLLLVLGLLIMRELYERLRSALLALSSTLTSSVSELHRGMLSILSDVSYVMIALALLALILLIAFLKVKASRRARADYVWRLRVLDFQKHVDSLVSLQLLLKEKMLSWNTAGYFIFGYTRHGLELFLCVKKLTKVQAEFIESFLKTLEPSVKWSKIQNAECPEYTSKNGLDDIEKPVRTFLKSVSRSSWIKSLEASLESSENESIVFARSKHDGGPVGIKISELYRHIGIFGSTGSGKTTTASVISLQAALNGQSVIILDWHGEYYSIFAKLKHERLPEIRVVNPIRERLSVNPLEGSIEETIDIMEDVFSLTPPQAATLYKILKENRGLKSLHQLILLLDSKYHDSYWERELRAALLRRLEAIDSSEGEILFSKKDFELSLNPGAVLIVDLSEIRSHTLKKLYALAFLRVLFQKAQSKRLQRLLVVLDEAHNLLPKTNDNFVSRMLAETRKFGIGLLLVTQSPSSINVEFIKNLNTKIVHSLKTGVDIRIVEESMALDSDKASAIPLLEVGEALFSSPSNPTPIHIVVEAFKRSRSVDARLC